MYQINPEFRSVTAVCVVEDLSKCPMGYTPISRTADSDKADADLWRDGFFARKVTRYLCISKSQGRPEHVVSDVQVIHERDLPPEGYSLIQSTVDTSQKAFQKKQLCCKVAHYRTNVESIVDIILLTKPKPPDSYENIGEINGLYLCVRKISAITRLQSPSLSYGVLPGMRPQVPMYPQLQDGVNDLSLNFNGNSPYPPNQPNMMDTSGAPYPSMQPSYPSATISTWTGLEGIPFILHETLSQNPSSNTPGRKYSSGPHVNLKSMTELDREYTYDFRTEREVLYQM